MSDKLHVAIIPDGNRRWARQRLLRPWLGHKTALDNVRGLLEWCKQDDRIGIMTFWGFSTENWNRDPEEIKYLMGFVEEYLQRERVMFKKEDIRFVHSGRTDRIPATLATALHDIQAETASHQSFILHLALDYGGRDEIIRAIHRLPDSKAVTAENFRQYVDQPELPDIDLIIRTSGEQRTSNFFLWQSTYAEWIFTPTFFPDFTPEHLAKAVEEFTQRSRRFGR
jgi:undecaprenyl diphosphate synthase